MKKWIIAGIAVLIVLVGALLLMTDSGQPGPAGIAKPAGPDMPVAPGSAGTTADSGFGGSASAPGTGQQQSAGGQAVTGAPAPWMASPQARDARASTATDLQKQKSLSELQAMQAELLRQTQQGKQPDTKLVDATLAKLQEVEGSPVVAGVNIPAVRSNLAKAQELQQLAQDMEREAKKPGGPDMNRLHAQMAQLQQLQSQLRSDVSPAQPGTPLPVMPGAAGQKK